MKSQPLNSSDQSKLLIFGLLLAPSVAFIVGAIPALFLGFGLFMMKKNEDFSHITTAVRNFRGYTLLILVACILLAIFFFAKTHNTEDSNRGDFYAMLFFSAICITYLVFVKFLFLDPLEAHREWIELNGIFSKNSKLATPNNAASEVDIIKGEKLKQYSVADELTKWVKLKEDGYITEEEFSAARKKLLERN